MATLLHQLYKTKLRLAGAVTAVAGIGLLFAARYVAEVPTLDWTAQWPLSELGAITFSAGIFGIIFEYYARNESRSIAAEQFRAVIRQEAPAIRDAVLDSLAFNPDTLKDVASPDILDRIATNALGLRLGDKQLAGDAYTDLRDQVISAPERWRDVDASVSLASWEKGPAAGRGSMIVATIRWEYRVVPASSIMRFACVADPVEYREMLRDPTITSVWHFDRSGGVDPGSTDVFELLQLTIDGKPRKIRRTTRAGAQVYAATLGRTAEGQEATVSYTYRVLAQRHSHLLYLDLPRPTKGLRVRLDYAATGIRRINTLDYFASTEQARVEQAPATAPAKTVSIAFDGWIFPRSGVAFVWVLEDEMKTDLPSL